MISAAVVLMLAGTFCVDGDCRPAATRPARIAPAAHARTFVWIDADRKKAVAGSIAAQEARVVERPGVSHDVTVQLADTPAAPVPVTLELVSAQRTWSFTIDVQAKHALALTHPACECTIRAKAAEYRVAEGAPGDSTLLLRPFPVLTGVVVDASTGSPLSGTEVAAGEAKSVTREDGAFRIVVEGDWPSSLRVRHPARALKQVAVPKVVASVELPPVRLTIGGALDVKIGPPIGGRDALSWELRRGDTQAALTRSGEIAPGTTDVRIDSLDPGAYRLHISGSEPLQRYSTQVRVTEGNTTETTIAVTPLVLEGAVTFDGAPLPSPSIELRPHGNAWVAKLTAGEDGRFVEELWQPGSYHFSVSREPEVRVWGTERDVEGDERVQVELQVPNRRIRGRVTDARSGSPVGDAVVVARAKFGRNVTIDVRSQTSADGAFEFTGIEAGEVTLTARKTGYRFDRPVSFTIGEDEPLHVESLALHALPVQRTILVTDARGIPLASAVVLAPGDGGALTPVASTDGNGRATVHLGDEDERRMVFVIPASGSFGFAPLAADESGIVRVRVRDDASLDLRMESTGGEPIPRIYVRMRIDGIAIPSEVLEHMTHMHGTALTSDASGRIAYSRLPPGQYELTPLVNRGDQRKGIAATPPPPARVAVLPGAQTVVMKFEAK